MRSVVVWGALTLAALAGVAYVTRVRLLTAIGGFLIARDAPQPADAIVVLSGSLPDRILEAVDLYQQQLAPRIILTREAPLPGLEALRARGGTLPEPHEHNRRMAGELGVPDTAIALMPVPASSTLTEVRALVRYLQAQQVRSILLVTSKAHSRRARMIFRRIAGDRIAVRVCPSRYDPFAADTWWQHRAFIRRVVIEYGKLFTYLLIDRWRDAPEGDGG